MKFPKTQMNKNKSVEGESMFALQHNKVHRTFTQREREKRKAIIQVEETGVFILFVEIMPDFKTEEMIN